MSRKTYGDQGNVPLKERMEYALLRGMVRLAAIMPRQALYALFDLLARLAFRILKRRREMARTNLRRAFPKKSEAEITEIARESFRSLGRTFAETVMIEAGRIRPEELVRPTPEGEAAVQRLRQWESEGRGVLLLTAHFGNWELGAHHFATLGLPMLVIGREGNNLLAEERFIRPMRERFGNRAVGKKRAAVAMMKRLKSGGRVGLLIDQKTGKKDRIMVEFFAQPAETTTAVAHLKRRLDPVLLPAFMLREEGGRYRSLIGEPVETECPDGMPEEECLRRISQACTDRIEAVIREHPEQWMWMHNRWRR